MVGTIILTIPIRLIIHILFKIIKHFCLFNNNLTNLLVLSDNLNEHIKLIHQSTVNMIFIVENVKK